MTTMQRADVYGPLIDGAGSVHVARLERAIRYGEDFDKWSPPGGCPTYHVAGAAYMLCDEDGERVSRGITLTLHAHSEQEVDCERCLELHAEAVGGATLQLVTDLASALSPDDHAARELINSAPQRYTIRRAFCMAAAQKFADLAQWLIAKAR